MAAYRTLDLPELELKTLEAIATFGARGCTQDEILDRFPSFTNETLTPRFAPLERKGLALRVAFGCAIRAFRKVYANVQTMNLHKGDTIKVEYTLEINR
jgi:hypothetical protein